MASDFDRDDLFGDFEDDEGGFDDFDDFDDEGEIGGFDDEFGDLGLEDEDITFDDDFDDSGDRAAAGPSPTFIIIAVVLIIALLGGLGLIAFFAITRPPSPQAQTATSIAATNAIVELQIAASATEAKRVLDVTMTASAWTQTPSNTPSPSPTSTPTEDQSAQETANAQATFEAANALATETAVAATETRFAQLNPSPEIVAASPTPLGELTEGTPIAGGATPVSLSAVQMTATALAQLFLATPTLSDVEPTTIDVGTGGEPTPTREVIGIGGEDELPQTGIVDDFFGPMNALLERMGLADIFGGNPATLFFAAFGLLGVIVVSRHLRSSNRKRK